MSSAVSNEVKCLYNAKAGFDIISKPAFVMLYEINLNDSICLRLHQLMKYLPQVSCGVVGLKKAIPA